MASCFARSRAAFIVYAPVLFLFSLSLFGSECSKSSALPFFYFVFARLQAAEAFFTAAQRHVSAGFRHLGSQEPSRLFASGSVRCVPVPLLTRSGRTDLRTSPHSRLASR